MFTTASRYRFIDTAGIRRKGKTKLLAEKLSVVMARKHLERADRGALCRRRQRWHFRRRRHHRGLRARVGPLGDRGDEQVGPGAIEAAREAAEELKKDRSRDDKGKGRDRERGAGKRGSSRQIATDPQRLAAEYEALVRERLKFLSYAPVIFLSALTGDRVEKLYAMIDRVAAARRRRISTGELNRWLANVDLSRGTSPTAHRVKIYYVTQASTSPPTFILFTNQRERLHFSFERFSRIGCARSLTFAGAPIRFIQRVREREPIARRSGWPRAAARLD